MHSTGTRRTALIGLMVVLTVIAAVATGCSGQPTTMGPATNAQPMQAASEGQVEQAAVSEMSCAMCNKGAPAAEKGEAAVENGVQVVRITLKDGYYSPNEIALKTGAPARLIFSGEAKDCAGKPKIATLKQQADFTQTGEATMELDVLSAGTYELTCGMGNTGGRLVVK